MKVLYEYEFDLKLFPILASILVFCLFFGVSETMAEDPQMELLPIGEQGRFGEVEIHFETVPPKPEVGESTLLKFQFINHTSQEKLPFVSFRPSIGASQPHYSHAFSMQNSTTGMGTISHTFDIARSYGVSVCVEVIIYGNWEGSGCRKFKLNVGLDLEEINQHSKEIIWNEKLIQGNLLENGSEYRKYFKIYHYPENLNIKHRPDGYGFGYEVKLPYPMEEDIVSIKIPKSNLNSSDGSLQNYRFIVAIDSYGTGFYKMEHKPCFTEVHIPIKEENGRIDLYILNKFGGTRNGIDLPPDCLNETTLIIPPIIQKNMGFSEEKIICEKEKVVFFKSVDNSPACVTKTTSWELIKRGWGITSDSYFFNKIVQEEELKFKKLQVPYQDFIFQYPSFSQRNEIADIYYSKTLIKEDFPDYKKTIFSGGIRLVTYAPLEDRKVPEDTNKIIEKFLKTWENAKPVDINGNPGVLVIDCRECDGMFGHIPSLEKLIEQSHVNRLSFYDENGYLYNILSLESEDFILEFARTLE